MDWSKTKTIFILTFLCLNIFLGYQLYEKHNRGNLNFLTEASLQMRLDDNRIEIEIEDAEETIDGAPITGTVRPFQEEFFINSLERQTPSVIDETILYSELDSPSPLVSANLRASVEAFLQQYVYHGDEYEFAQFNEQEQYIGLYQTYKGRKIDQYEREDFHLVLHLNEDLEVESYSQKYMSVSEQEGREQELLSPLKAVERLLNQQYIRQNTVITEAELGYYSRIQLDANFQVFAPMWRIIANDEIFFVDAINGEVQSAS
ncbi:hypothetical protein CR194_19290 [Salipaludibacillus keqinensis]|uniref:Regulatory protein YycH-like domain-containing protein n=1 Tax=Salipaludibacillus keqinensis TaxID=2045207 RepID=A0A323T620_9BACI|nr:two-component system regulatory protein YycI [Salipaludibacillus keqinensis]PYZ91768.1 hypothetical protein CR194_19290 [Salipaludibacillus keqinensis]